MDGGTEDGAGDAMERMGRLHHAAIDIGEAATVHQVFERTVETADHVLQFDSCAVFVAEETAFRLAAHSGYVPDADRFHDIDEGIAGATLRDDEPKLVVDAADNEAAKPVRDAYRSAISVPIGTDVVFQAISKTPGYYDESELELAGLLALHVEAALDRIRSEQDIREQKRKIKELHRVATDLESCMSHSELLDRSIDAASNILGFDWCGVFRPGQEYFVTAAVSEDAPVEVGDRTLQLYEGHTGRAYETGESFLTGNIEESETSRPYLDEINSGLTVAMGDVGVLSAVSSEVGAFDEADLELAELLAANAAEAHDRISAENELRERQRELDLLKQVQSRVLRHDIRNELTVLVGLARKMPDADDEETRALLDEIIETADRLHDTSEKARQVRQVIDHTDGQTTVNLSAVVESVASDLADEFPAATIDHDVPEQVFVDAHRDISLAVRNLVENGLVHTADNPTVRIEIERDDGRVTCRVIDNGPGIPEFETDIIEQGSETELEHGSGVGLWLVDIVVDRSDGTLSFSVDDGAIVELRLRASG